MGGRKPFPWWDENGNRWCSSHKAYLPLDHFRPPRINNPRQGGYDRFCIACRKVTNHQQHLRRTRHRVGRHQNWNAAGDLWCSGCQDYIPKELFSGPWVGYRPTRGGYDCYCRLCRAKTTARYRQKHREECRERSRRYVHNNPEKVRKARRERDRFHTNVRRLRREGII